MDPKWFPLADRPVRAGGFILIPFMLICTTSFLLPPGRTRVLFTLPPLLYLLLQVRRTTSGTRTEDYMIALNVYQFFHRYLASVLFSTAEDEVYRVVMSGEKKGVKEPEDARTMDLWSKLKWSTHFWFSVRGIGWNWQVKNVDDVPEKLQRKRSFMIAQLLGILRGYIVIDLIGHYIRSSAYGRGISAPPLLSDSLSRQILFGWLYAIRSYFDLAYGYHICALVTVGIGLTEPALWPYLFGSFTEAYTMRKVWGYCWHQFCRTLFQGPCNFVLAIFRIPKGGILSRYVQLYLSFFISAIIHHLGSLNTPYVPAVKHQFLFFMVQPVAITFEDFAIHIAKKLGVRPSVATRVVGHLWVLSFLSFSLRFLVSYIFQLGIGAVEHPLIWSTADRVL